MANLGAPPKTQFVTLVENDYECTVLSITEGPNDHGKFAYDPMVDKPEKATILKFVYVTREIGKTLDGDVVPVGHQFSEEVQSYFTRHAKNKPMLRCRVLDSSFDINTGYASVEALQKACESKACRVNIKNTEGVNKDGDKVVYNNIDGLLPSKMAAPDTTQIDAAMASLGAEINAPL